MQARLETTSTSATFVFIIKKSDSQTDPLLLQATQLFSFPSSVAENILFFFFSKLQCNILITFNAI